MSRLLLSLGLSASLVFVVPASTHAKTVSPNIAKQKPGYSAFKIVPEGSFLIAAPRKGGGRAGGARRPAAPKRAAPAAPANRAPANAAPNVDVNNRNVDVNRGRDVNVNVNKDVNVRVVDRNVGWRGRHWGAAVFGITLGTVIVVAANTPPPPPDPSLCWTWTNAALTEGYWYYCDGD